MKCDYIDEHVMNKLYRYNTIHSYNQTKSRYLQAMNTLIYYKLYYNTIIINYIN